jgi:hypothetical protein
MWREKMDLDDERTEEYESLNDDERHEETEIEIEDERSNGFRGSYINRELVFSEKYIVAIKSLNETKYCTQNILTACRNALTHHHGDKYEDLYFIDSITNKMLARVDYRKREQEVTPTRVMKTMARNSNNIICVHNHPTNALPSPEDIKSCYSISYKYGLIACHNGTIYQYETFKKPNLTRYTAVCKVLHTKESLLKGRYEDGHISIDDFEALNQENFVQFLNGAHDSGVSLKILLDGRKKGELI